ncbi:DNA primase [Ureaplasma miroungigenitalium]|uniref:DNA primase n=1 Tax=Ureaplasma miroungigenitalium TaxID=1042321 RepID=A0ABT3BMY9_9BACT|nr:DNA primase [Ureaplasma miroungigenitalium]MCV3728593.1 DNA primase [Ureaplasma miroungigenitalium]
MSNINLFNSIRAQVKISDIIKQYINIVKKGSNYIAICPFHNDTKPSLSINDQKQIFKCFACNQAGDGIKFVAEKNNISYQEAAVKIVHDHNLDPSLLKNLRKQSPYEQLITDTNYLNTQVLTYFQMWLNDAKCQNVKQILIDRKIEPSMIELFRLGYAPKHNLLTQVLKKVQPNLVNENPFFSWKNLENASILNLDEQAEYRDYFFDRIIFPITDVKNNVIGFSGRALDNKQTSKYMNTRESKVFFKKQTLYNLYLAQQNLGEHHTLYICEGFFDAISAYQSGVKNIVATMGVALTKDHLRLLKNVGVKRLILAFDNDRAGLEVTLKYINQFKQQGFELFVLNQAQNKYKDFNDVLVHEGEQKLQTLLTHYDHYSVFYLRYLADLYQQTTDLIKQNALKKDLQNVLSVDGNENYIQAYAESYIKVYPQYSNDLAYREIYRLLTKVKTNNEAPKALIKPTKTRSYHFNDRYVIANSINVCALFAAILQSKACYNRVVQVLDDEQRLVLLNEYIAMLDYFDALYLSVSDVDDIDLKRDWFIHNWDVTEYDQATNILYEQIQNYLVNPSNKWPWKSIDNEMPMALQDFDNWAIKNTIPFLRRKKNLSDH